MPARAARESGAPTGASPRVVLPIRGGDTRQALLSTIRALGIDAHYRTLSYIWHHRPSTVGSRSNEIFSALRDADNGLWSFAFSPWFPPRRITLLAIYSRAGTQRILVAVVARAPASDRDFSRGSPNARHLEHAAILVAGSGGEHCPRGEQSLLLFDSSLPTPLCAQRNR